MTYKDKLKDMCPNAVREAFTAGAYGCPGDWFVGAPAWDSTKECNQCVRCWKGIYKKEKYRKDAPEDRV